MKVVFVPFNHNNDYIDINKKAIRAIGLQPVAFSLKVLLASFSRRYPLVLNWVEDKPYGSKLNNLESFIAFIKCLGLVVAGAAFFSKKISIKHNFKPHNITGKGFYFNVLRNLMIKLGYRLVSLEEHDGGGLVHPLYLDDEAMERAVEDKNNELLNYVFFGAVKPYKGLDLILNSWPNDKCLKIFGKCDDEKYENELRHIITKRNLKVTWNNTFLPIQDLNRVLGDADFVLMNHLDNTMISSGSFYHAISFGCNIIAAPSKFTVAKSEQHQFVHIFRDLNTDLPNIEASYVCKNKVRREAKKEYSRYKLSEKWRQLLLH